MRKIEDSTLIQKKELEVLLFVKNFCDKYGIRYYLCGGTLLGAVRHNGFIPWDDDIDLYMPRPDYDRFLKCFNKESQHLYKVLSPETPGYYYNFAKVVDTRTKLVEKDVNEIAEMGLYIDIFPLDGMPSGKEKQLKHFKRLNQLREKIFDYEYGFPKPRKNIVKYLYRVSTYIQCRFRSLNKCQLAYVKAANEYKYDESQMVFVTGGRYKTKDIFPIEYFGNGVNLFFEGIAFKSPENYELILKQLYGDYMKLPPEKDRVNRHGFVVYLLEKCN